MSKTTRFRHYRDDSQVELLIPRYLIADIQFLFEELQTDEEIKSLSSGERYCTTARELWKRIRTAYVLREKEKREEGLKDKKDYENKEEKERKKQLFEKEIEETHKNMFNNLLSGKLSEMQQEDQQEQVDYLKEDQQEQVDYLVENERRKEINRTR